MASSPVQVNDSYEEKGAEGFGIHKEKFRFSSSTKEDRLKQIEENAQKYDSAPLDIEGRIALGKVWRQRQPEKELYDGVMKFKATTTMERVIDSLQDKGLHVDDLNTLKHKYQKLNKSQNQRLQAYIKRREQVYNQDYAA